MPVDINAEANYDPDQKLREFANKDEPNEEQNDAKQRKMEGLVKSNIEAAQAKQKKYYDEKFGASSCFRVGSTVLKKDFTRKKRWKAGLPLAGSIHHHCSSWKRAFSTEGATWRQGRFFLCFLLKKICMPFLLFNRSYMETR